MYIKQLLLDQLGGFFGTNRTTPAYGAEWVWSCLFSGHGSISRTAKHTTETGKGSINQINVGGAHCCFAKQPRNSTVHLASG